MKIAAAATLVAATMTVVTLPAGVASSTSSTSSASSVSAERSTRVAREMTTIRGGEGEFADLTTGGRVLDEDRAGLHVFWQIRSCGKGGWRNLKRETTTKRGVYDFSDTSKPKLRKKFKVKDYKVTWPEETQFRVFIPATDTHKAVRAVSPQCWG